MIFATVGTQLPFPRLMSALDSMALKLGERVVAQTGPNPGEWPNLDCRETLRPAQFEEFFTTARVVVAHAGIGTILSAKRWGKPLIIMPRRVEHEEHRNDHQMATARQVAQLPGVHVAWDVEDLENLLRQPRLEAANSAPSASHQALLARLNAFIQSA